jgi:hypothetical protein
MTRPVTFPAPRATPNPTGRWRSALAAAGLLAAAGQALAAIPTPAEAAADFHQNIQPLLKQYCYDCHGDGESKGQVAFDKLGSDQEILANTKLWTAALKNVRVGLMPASGPKPTAAEIDRLARWVKYDALRLDPADPDPGRVTVHRLNRVEYTNTIRDLMGVDFSAEAAFPPDDSGRGFDNNGDVLSISSLLLEKYLQAADTIVKQAVPTVAKVIPVTTATGQDFKLTAGKGDSHLLSSLTAATTSHTFTVDRAETYRMVIDLQGVGTFDFSPGHCRVIGRLDGKELFQEEVVWHERQPIHYEFTQAWTAGPHEVTFEVVPLALIATPKLLPPDPVDPALPAPKPAAPAADAAPAGAVPTPAAAPDAAPAVAAATPAATLPATPAAAGDPVKPGPRRGAGPPRPVSLNIRIDTVRLEGPLNPEFWVAPDNYTRFFPKPAAPTAPAARAAYARDVLRAFAARAFRRPVEDAKVNQLADIARATYEQPGKSFEEGIAHAMLFVLASPRFLFRVDEPEAVPAGAAYAPVDEYSLASRLSYFLWSSMPDQELFDLAAKGELRARLPAQIDRMLKDSRSQGLVKNFVGQWLQARDIETVPINARVILGILGGPNNVAAPVDFNGPIRKAMHRETEMYFDHVMREDRSVLEFLDSDYTYLNELLAKHYGIPDVTGDEMRLVKLPPDSPRGGLLTQGTILAVTSNPTRTSPVKRGLFILDNFLGAPPPPPPPSVPALEDAKPKNADHEPTLREMQEAHRADPLCSSCHSRMDPLGLALENFNAMGNWRDKDNKQPIDSTGQLITGEKFKNVQELKHILAHDRQLDFYRCLTEKLLTYALGRGLESYDVETVDQIVDQLARQNGRFSAVLNGVINSAPFQKQRLETNPPATVVKTASVP